MTKKKYGRLRYLYYWLMFITSYVFPFSYFFVKWGITKQRTALVIPTVLLLLVGVIKLASDIPDWVRTWSPSFKKGLLKALPKLLLFFSLITVGLGLQYVLKRQIRFTLLPYFETVFVLFGSMSVGSIFGAFHLKYKELHLMSKGYVLGVVNR